MTDSSVLKKPTEDLVMSDTPNPTPDASAPTAETVSASAATVTIPSDPIAAFKAARDDRERARRLRLVELALDVVEGRAVSEDELAALYPDPDLLDALITNAKARSEATKLKKGGLEGLTDTREKLEAKLVENRATQKALKEQELTLESHRLRACAAESEAFEKLKRLPESAAASFVESGKLPA